MTYVHKKSSSQFTFGYNTFPEIRNHVFDYLTFENGRVFNGTTQLHVQMHLYCVYRYTYIRKNAMLIYFVLKFN